MFGNFFKIVFRNLKRQKAFSFINIFGFALGLSVCIIISLFLMQDLTFDHFHEDSDDIYRLLTSEISKEGSIIYGITSGPLVVGLAEGISSIEASTRITSFGYNPVRKVDENENIEFDPVQARLLVADENFFDVFDFSIISGEKSNPLQNPDGVYLSEKIATAIFGEEDPLGKPVSVMDLENAFVAGIIEDVPLNSSIQFEAIVPLHMEWNPVWWDSWTNVALTGYLKTVSGTDEAILQKEVEAFASNNGFAKVWEPKLQRLKDVHLHSSGLRFDVMNWRKSEMSRILFFGIIAVLVLLIASINFVNLSSARANKRAKEVGIRKVVGSRKNHLVIQFLGESLMITYFAGIISFIHLEIATPYLNNLLGGSISWDQFWNPIVLLPIFGVITIIGLLAGIYPALILSSFNVTSVVKGGFKSSKKGVTIRRILVVSQFAVSISLISAVFIVREQINFLNKIDLGYSRENVISVFVGDPDNTEIMKEEISKLSSVESVGSIASFPGGTLIKFEVVPEGLDIDESAMFDRLQVDEGLLSTLGIQLTAGKNFNPGNIDDIENGVILNEAAVRFAGWKDNPVGKIVTIHREDGEEYPKRVLGVVKDFNYTTTRRNVNPMFLSYLDGAGGLVVKTNGSNNEAFIQQMEEIYNSFGVDRPFNYNFFEDIFNNQFIGDRSFAKFISIFSMLAIIISCLGLLGLSSFITEQRTKEIGIRKVMGSSVLQIVKLLSADFMRWVLLANLIAWPVTWFVMQKWLQEFIYKMNPNPLIFLTAGFIVASIAMLTISFQTVKAANANPVKSLKYE